MEHDWAKDAGRRRYLWVTPEDFAVPGNLYESGAQHKRQQAFRVRVMAGGDEVDEVAADQASPSRQVSARELLAEAQRRFSPIRLALAHTTAPGGIKVAMTLLGGDAGPNRGPIALPTEGEREKIKAVLRRVVGPDGAAGTPGIA